MEIKNTLQKLADPYRTQIENTPREGRANTQAAEAQPKGDRVSLSPEALLRTEAYSAAMNAPDVRAAKVNDIKERVASGEYKVDAKNIAAKLLQSETDLAGAVKP